jgi:hypothetical protein
MAYAPSADCREFWMATLTQTRKYRNLEENPRASLLIDDRGECAGAGMALCVEVEMRPFKTSDDYAAACAALLHRHGNLAEFLGTGDVRMLRLVAGEAQLRTGVDEVFLFNMEKVLDG